MSTVKPSSAGQTRRPRSLPMALAATVAVALVVTSCSAGQPPTVTTSTSGVPVTIVGINATGTSSEIATITSPAASPTRSPVQSTDGRVSPTNGVPQTTDPERDPSDPIGEQTTTAAVPSRSAGTMYTGIDNPDGFDPDHIDQRDPVQTAAGFVGAYAAVTGTDSLASNTVTRSAQYSTATLQARLRVTFAAAPPQLPTGASTKVYIQQVSVLPIPKPSRGGVAVRIDYSTRVVVAGSKISGITGVYLNCAVQKQADGTWLVADVWAGAN